ncbi:MAG: hypothetical protein AAGC44_13035 [Planctomycetota bacterium]
MMVRLFMLLLVVGLLGGCAHTVQTDNPVTVSPSEYRPAFDATVRTLREHGFRIARNDYRFGVISTYPKESPTLAEPWIGDHTTRAQARRATLNAERRVVTARLERADGAIAQTAGPDAFALFIEVEVQRRREPQRFLTHSAGGYITRQYTSVPVHLRGRGIEGVYWQAVGRDGLLEQRLLAEVLANARSDQ